MFLELLASATRRFGWIITAWVLMTNHFHLVIETPRTNRNLGMNTTGRVTLAGLRALLS